MHPQIRWDHPGNCPICGMALEPLEPAAEERANPELIDMSRRFWTSAAFTLPLVVLAFGSELLGWQPLPMSQSVWLQLALATPVVLWGGWPFFERLWASLKTRRSLGAAMAEARAAAERRERDLEEELKATRG